MSLGIVIFSAVALAFLAVRWARAERARFVEVLQEVAMNVDATGKQVRGMHLTALAARVRSAWFLAGRHDERAAALLLLARSNARLQNMEETNRLGQAASKEYQKIRPRRGPAFAHALERLATLNANIGLELERTGQIVHAYEKLKLALDLTVQRLEGAPELVQATTAHEPMLRGTPEGARLLEVATRLLTTLLEAAELAQGDAERIDASQNLIAILPFDFADAHDKAKIMRLIVHNFAEVSRPSASEDTVPLAQAAFSSRGAVVALERAQHMFASKEFFAALFDTAQAQAHALADDDPYSMAFALGLGANTYQALGRPSESLAYLWASAAVLETAKMPNALEAERDAAIGNTFRQLGRLEDAQQYLKRSIEVAQGDASAGTLFRAYLDLARVYLGRRMFSLAEKAVSDARRTGSRRPFRMEPEDESHLWMVTTLVRLTEVLESSRNDPPSRSDPRWPQLCAALRDYVGRHAAPHWWLLDIADGASGRPERAVARYLRRSWQLATSSTDRPSHIASGFAYGVFLNRVLRDPAKAVAVLNDAARALEAARGRIVELGYRRSLLGTNRELYDELVVCLARIGREQNAFEASEDSRARTLIDLFHGNTSPSASTKPASATGRALAIERSLDDVLLGSRLSEVVARAPGARAGATRGCLHEAECVLEFHVTANRTYVFALTGTTELETFVCEQGQEFYENVLTRHDWLRPIESAASAGGTRTSASLASVDTLLARALEEISRELFASTRSRRRGSSLGEFLAPKGRAAFQRITLIPHRTLWSVPLHCAKLGETLLCELEHATGGTVTVSYAHSAGILTACRERVRPRDRGLLVVRHPDFATDPVFDSVKGVAHAHTPLDDVSVERLLGKLGGRGTEFSSLLFLTHGHFASADPARSYLALGAERLTLADVLLNFRTESIDDVFLAACSSGCVEVDGSSDDYLGVGMGFLYAGARNVIGTRWPISTAACAGVAAHYYGHRATKDAANSLSYAARDVRRSGALADWEWSAFYCLGA